jgi:hypothetical protein
LPLCFDAIDHRAKPFELLSHIRPLHGQWHAQIAFFGTDP